VQGQNNTIVSAEQLGFAVLSAAVNSAALISGTINFFGWIHSQTELSITLFCCRKFCRASGRVSPYRDKAISVMSTAVCMPTTLYFFTLVFNFFSVGSEAKTGIEFCYGKFLSALKLSTLLQPFR
jgi:hypothetical protein